MPWEPSRGAGLRPDRGPPRYWQTKPTQVLLAQSESLLQGCPSLELCNWNREDGWAHRLPASDRQAPVPSQPLT